MNRIITAAPTESNSSPPREEHISFSKHEPPNVINSLHTYSKLVSMPNGQISNISNNYHGNTVLPPLTTVTVMSSPHVKYQHHVEVSNNSHGSHSNVSSSLHSHAQQLADHQHPMTNHHHQLVHTASTSSNSSSTTNVVNFPITNNNVSNGNTKTKEEGQTFIVDYMFKENAGIKKSKKIKRKYEFKRKDSIVSNDAEKPHHVRVSYIVMEEEELKSCESISEVLEKHYYSNETCFDYSIGQKISIVPVDSNVKFSRKRTVENITTDEMIRILHLTQQQACTLLGCSLSTIKRKFYSIRNELGIDKWPHNYLEYQNCSFFDNFYPMSMKFILNDQTESKTCNNESDSQRCSYQKVERDPKFFRYYLHQPNN